MTIFKDILGIWKSDNLLAQAWDDSLKMLSISNDIFVQSIQYFNSGKNIDAVKALKKEDQTINDYYQLVRRKVLTHYSIDKPPVETSGGLTLVNMVVDIERIGDYCKNISDLTLMRDGPMDFGELSDDIKSIEQEVESRFTKTIQAIENQDEALAENLLNNYKKMVTKVSDRIVKDIASGRIQFPDSSQGASIALYSRYLKRIGAHLKNITSTIVNPYDKIGYNQ
ncbi:MAG: PhoU domain-containing protein [Candidatus Neomarinimicrobiota bacterium]|jgi:phosphate uptake regulator|nr:PhoU domain-containing protein [Candidatus Neomarinimicrobiota bacterium]MEC9448617.1 PhoU domain-containing protein [Candidatus Neomarinimicrobiota bacterium]|tara:strand:+ start:247 stop:921 length:675 start_codon:yes stop_codon:yes gene_type:complete